MEHTVPDVLVIIIAALLVFAIVLGVRARNQRR